MDAHTDDENSLWQRSRSGDGAAFGLLFDRHRNRVYWHAYRLLTAPHEAEDATAIAFLELWRKRRHVNLVDGSVLPWLLVTTTNASRNLQRSRRRYQRLLQKLPRADAALSVEDDLLTRSEITEDIAGALSQLDAEDARLLTLIALEGYTPTEVATALGTSSGAVRTRLHRIRARLRRQLGSETLADYVAEEKP